MKAKVSFVCKDGKLTVISRKVKEKKDGMGGEKNKNPD